ncbi:hypothetical protein AB0I53_23450 [Saccharopolyspora sp. NPDC050389]|uniref:hypothetical protein n=1 Tax=Saccharopolyspora sp. NPDC050389 TaxID=3155516 RepID=UPI0033C9F30D
MGKVHVRPGLCEDIGGPVPAVGRFQHHLEVGAGLGDFSRQNQRVIVDAGDRQSLSRWVLPHDHRPASVDIDADELFAVMLRHKGLLRRVT